MSTESNKKVVGNFFENFTAGNIDASMALLADTVTWWVAGKPDQFALAGTKNKSAIAEALKRASAELPNGHTMRLTGYTAEGERVAVEAESYGETGSGKIYNNLYHFLFIVRDGKIQEAREYFDTLHAQDVLLNS